MKRRLDWQTWHPLGSAGGVLPVILIWLLPLSTPTAGFEPRSTAAAQQLTGIIASVNVRKKSLIVSHEDRQYLVRVTEKTAITLDGRSAGLEQLKPGQNAVVEFVIGADSEPTEVAASIAARTKK